MCSRHRDFVLTLRMRMLSGPRVCVCSCTARTVHRETKRNRYICPSTHIRIYVLADERALAEPCLVFQCSQHVYKQLLV